MEQRRKHHRSGSSFMLGVVVGVILTLLFTTKRGRAVVKDLTEKGLDTFSELQERLQRTEEDLVDDYEDEEIEGDDYIQPEPAKEPPKEVRYLAEEVTEKEEKKPVEKAKEPVKENVEKKEEKEAPKVAEQAKEAVKEKREESDAPKKSSVRRFFKLKK